MENVLLEKEFLMDMRRSSLGSVLLGATGKKLIRTRTRVYR